MVRPNSILPPTPPIAIIRPNSILPPTPTPPPPHIYEVFKTVKPCNIEECPVCYESINDDTYVHLNCNHEFCKTCVKTIMKRPEQKKCPMCRSCITEIHTNTPIVTYSI
jgi:hypothetical protein